MLQLYRWRVKETGSFWRTVRFRLETSATRPSWKIQFNRRDFSGERFDLNHTFIACKPVFLCFASVWSGSPPGGSICPFPSHRNTRIGLRSRSTSQVISHIQFTHYDRPWRLRRGNRVTALLSVNLAADGDGCIRHAPADLPPEMSQYSLHRSMGGPQCWSGRGAQNLAPLRLRSPDRLSISSYIGKCDQA